jgi:hypothetical protein
VESGYSDSNPYHNALHVAQVVHRLHTMLTTGGFMSSHIAGSSSTMLAALLAAVGAPCFDRSTLIAEGHVGAKTFQKC